MSGMAQAAVQSAVGAQQLVGHRKEMGVPGTAARAVVRHVAHGHMRSVHDGLHRGHRPVRRQVCGEPFACAVCLADSEVRMCRATPILPAMRPCVRACVWRVCHGLHDRTARSPSNSSTPSPITSPPAPTAVPIAPPVPATAAPTQIPAETGASFLSSAGGIAVIAIVALVLAAVAFIGARRVRQTLHSDRKAQPLLAS